MDSTDAVVFLNARTPESSTWPLSGIWNVTRAMSSRSSIRSRSAPSSPCR
jgi:hypothetical protein